ncbi:hypothetical protein [Streptomyces sp. Tu102]|nr:hypothetical protein [Streptomyces sp. Tu102]
MTTDESTTEMPLLYINERIDEHERQIADRPDTTTSEEGSVHD